MRCPHCDNPIIDAALACAFCGHRVSSELDKCPLPASEDAVTVGPCEEQSNDRPAEAVCDSCGAPMRAGREMCEACERAFSSVLKADRPGTEPTAAPREDVDTGVSTVRVTPTPASTPATSQEAVAPPEPWWKAQRRQPSVPPTGRRSGLPAQPARPVTKRALVVRPMATARPAQSPVGDRPAKRSRAPHAARTSRQLVRPAFAAAAALTIALVLGAPPLLRSGLIPVRTLGTIPIDARPVGSLIYAPAGSTPGPTPAMRDAGATSGTPAEPASAKGTTAAPSARKPAERTTSRTRRSTGRPASAGGESGDPVQTLPATEPLPVSPIAPSLALSSTAPPMAAERAETVLASPPLEMTQVDVRPDIRSRVAPRVPDALSTKRVEDVVVLRVLVSPAGRAADVRILRASKIDAALDTAAVEAVRQWQFTPAQKDGRPVSCWFSVGVPVRGGE